MKWYAVLILAVALTAPAHAAAPPRCSEVRSVAPLLDGRYSDVTCPEGGLRVVGVPPLGPARVEHTPAGRGRAASTALVAGGARYAVVQR